MVTGTLNIFPKPCGTVARSRVSRAVARVEGFSVHSASYPEPYPLYNPYIMPVV